jgi:glycerol-3-phosphate acyltransferase PlsY
VLGTSRTWLAATTLFIDALKGTAAVLLVYRYYGCGFEYFARELARPAALGAFLGATLFPVSPGFKDGKGVATYIGILLRLAWPSAIAFCLIWLAVATLTRYTSLASLIASAATPFMLWGLGELPAGGPARRAADDIVVDHALGQHFAPARRDRRQDRQAGCLRLKLMTAPSKNR